jgi:hypothetical protein
VAMLGELLLLLLLLHPGTLQRPARRAGTASSAMRLAGRQLFVVETAEKRSRFEVP